MVNTFGVCYTVLALLGVSQASQLLARDVDISGVTQFQGALLLINGNQTTCESVLVDSNAGFIAASCLNDPSDSATKSGVAYEIVIKTGSGSAVTEKYTITQIDVHPHYNADTYVNNLAMIQFNTDSKVAWQNYIGINPDEWDDQFFIRRSLSSVSSLSWNNIVAFSNTDTPNYCYEASEAYSANSDDFLCNYAASLSIYNTTCKVPYGVVYAAVQPDDISVVAIHSHSAVYGESMCSKDRKLHYYTVLRNYVGWAAGVLGRSVGGFAKDSSFEFSPVQGYKMEDVSKSGVDGVKVFSGDQYSQNPIDPALAEPEPPVSSSSSSSSSSSDESSLSSSLSEALLSEAQTSATPAGTLSEQVAVPPPQESNAESTTSESKSLSQEPSSSPAAAESSSLPPPSSESPSPVSDSIKSSAVSHEPTTSSSESLAESSSESSDTSSSSSSSKPLSSESSHSESPSSESSPSPSSDDSQSNSPSGSELFNVPENTDSDDPEASGQNIISDTDTPSASNSASNNNNNNNNNNSSSSSQGSDGGNYVDYQVNSDGEVSSSVVDIPNIANGANESEQKGVDSNRLVVIIVLVIGAIALVGAAIAWYVIRRKKQAIRRQNNWNQRESVRQLPNAMRMTADLAQDVNSNRDTIMYRQASAAENGWRTTNYGQDTKAYPRDTTNTAWTTNNNQTTTDDILSQYYGQHPPYEGNYRH